MHTRVAKAPRRYVGFPNLQRAGSSVAHPVFCRSVLVILAGLLAFRALFYPLVLVLTCQLLCVGLLFARFSNLAIGLRTFGRRAAARAAWRGGRIRLHWLALIGRLGSGCLCNR